MPTLDLALDGYLHFQILFIYKYLWKTSLGSFTSYDEIPVYISLKAEWFDLQ